ncbi:MAG TPA: hypothetical protein VK731_05765, partial [Candidatus Cybelea sp.]|nr:hypothetical protein [Candidatus Cybelea sp.]
MTAHTPATKAGGAASLLASISPAPPSPPSTVKDDFTAVMLQALGDGSDARDGADHPTATQMAQSKPASKGAPAPAPLTAYFLLSLLTPPKPTATSAKAAASDTAADAAVPSAPEKSSPKEVATDPSLAGLILALLAPPLPSLPKPTAHKNAALSIPVGPSVPPSPPAAAQSAGEAGAAKADEAEKTPPSVAQTLPPKEPEIKPLPTSGTSAASPSPRMSFSSERNEIAGR